MVNKEKGSHATLVGRDKLQVSKQIRSHYTIIRKRRSRKKNEKIYINEIKQDDVTTVGNRELTLSRAATSLCLFFFLKPKTLFQDPKHSRHYRTRELPKAGGS